MTHSTVISVRMHCLSLMAIFSTAVQAEVSEASSHNPGLPPSSLMSFLRVKPGISGVVLGDFNTHFINPFYQSHLDANVSIDAVTSAAVVAARALHETAFGGSEVPPLKVHISMPL